MWDDEDFAEELDAEMAENIGMEFLDGPSAW